jgi:hypothetical protein
MGLQHATTPIQEEATSVYIQFGLGRGTLLLSGVTKQYNTRRQMSYF